MGLFKRAAVRGIAHELVRRGAVSFQSKEAMDEAADAVADAAPPSMPEMAPEGGHAPEDIASIANKLIELGMALQQQAGPAAPKMAADFAKIAASVDYEAAAAEAAVSCMDKAAAEKASGALMEGGDKGNTPSDAAKTNDVAKLDEKQRPQGAYQVAAGDTALDSSKGHVGDLKANPEGPKNSPSGSNSLTEDAKKAAALRETIQKYANKLVGLHDGKDSNTLADAAKHDTVAKLDQKQRPEGKYKVSPGGANFSEPQSARVGKEEPHPNGPSNSPSGTNSVIQASKAAEEEAFVLLFKKTAEDVGPYLPQKLTEDEKIAEISKMIGFSHEQRQVHLDSLHKVATEVPPPVAEKKEEGEKKESSLLARIREIAAQPVAPAAS